MGLLSGSPWQRWIWSVEVNGGENNDRYPSSHLPGIFFDGVYPFPVFLAASPRWFSLTTSSFTMTLQSPKKRHPQIYYFFQLRWRAISIVTVLHSIPVIVLDWRLEGSQFTSRVRSSPVVRVKSSRLMCLQTTDRFKCACVSCQELEGTPNK